jgi:hypothetical protein
MRRCIAICILQSAICILCPGCLTVPEGRVPEPMTLNLPATMETEDAEDVVYDAVSETLKRSLFDIDRVDRAYGQVITKPMIAAGPLEVWRRDSVGFANYLEGLGGRIRRTVVAEIKRKSPGVYTVDMRANTERFENPTARLRSPGETLQQSLFLQQNPVEDRTNASAITTVPEPRGGFWEDLGRDRELERKLLVRLQRRLRRDHPEAVPAAESQKAE